MFVHCGLIVPKTVKEMKLGFFETSIHNFFIGFEEEEDERIE